MNPWSYHTLSLFLLAFVARSVRGNHGKATWYHTGQGACGAHSNDNDHVIAISTEEFDANQHCFKHVMVYHDGRAVDATIVDRCEGCERYSLDMSPGLFKNFAPLESGVLEVDWSYESK